MSLLPNNSAGAGKWWAGFAAAFAATYVVDVMDKVYGVDFTQYGMSDAMFKGLLEGSFVSFLVWLTPSHLVQSVTDAILFAKGACKQWRNAITKGDDQ